MAKHQGLTSSVHLPDRTACLNGTSVKVMSAGHKNPETTIWKERATNDHRHLRYPSALKFKLLMAGLSLTQVQAKTVVRTIQ
jgi:hypothetical protein